MKLFTFLQKMLIIILRLPINNVCLEILMKLIIFIKKHQHMMKLIKFHYMEWFFAKSSKINLKMLYSNLISWLK